MDVTLNHVYQYNNQSNEVNTKFTLRFIHSPEIWMTVIGQIWHRQARDGARSEIITFIGKKYNSPEGPKTETSVIMPDAMKAAVKKAVNQMLQIPKELRTPIKLEF